MDGILNLIESVSEGFLPTLSYMYYTPNISVQEFCENATVLLYAKICFNTDESGENVIF